MTLTIEEMLLLKQIAYASHVQNLAKMPTGCVVVRSLCQCGHTTSSYRSGLCQILQKCQSPSIKDDNRF